MSMKTALFFLALICAAGPPAAVRAGSDRPDPAPALHGRFVQTKSISGLSMPLLSRGTFALLPGRGLVWRTLTPLSGTVVLTPKGVFALDAGAPRRLASGTDPLALMNEILKGNVDALERSFVVSRGIVAAGNWRLVLAPRPGPLAAVFTSIEAEGGRFANRARLVERSGDVTEIRFEGVRQGPGALDAAEESLLGP
jgi:hypothetical protein